MLNKIFIPSDELCNELTTNYFQDGNCPGLEEILVREETCIISKGKKVTLPDLTANRIIEDNIGWKDLKGYLKKSFPGGEFYSYHVGKDVYYLFNPVYLLHLEKDGSLKKIEESEMYVKITTNQKQVYRRFRSYETAELEAFIYEFEQQGGTYFVSGYEQEDRAIWRKMTQAGQTVATVHFSEAWKKKNIKIVYKYNEDYYGEDLPEYVLVCGVNMLWQYDMERMIPSAYYEYPDDEELERMHSYDGIDGIFFEESCPEKEEKIRWMREVSGKDFYSVGTIKGKDFLSDILTIMNQCEEDKRNYRYVVNVDDDEELPFI